jgi:protein phosphatase
MSTITMIGMTDPGMVRLENEDSIGTHPEAGLAVLADGMGGHQAGEVASHMAVDVITRYLTDPYPPDRDQPATSRVAEAIRRANRAIHEAAHARPECAGMGSTVVVTLLRDGMLVVGHVGDSRLYRLRAGQLEQITMDHSVVQELVNRGLFTLEEARQSVGKNLVTRALGVDPEVEADVAMLPLQPGDIFLLCSDGLNDVVGDNEIAETLNGSAANLYTAAFRMVALANQRGGPDNISVILARQEMDESSNKDSDKMAQDRNKSAGEDGGNEFNITRHDKFIV